VSPLKARPSLGGKNIRAGLGFKVSVCRPIPPGFLSGFFRGLQMQNKNHKRFYSPQFSELAAVSVRRLAWALEKPMPYAVDHIIGLLPSVVDSSKVCLSCRDSSKCAACIFGNLSNKQASSTLAVGV